MKSFISTTTIILFAINISAQNYSLQFDGVDDYGKTTQVASVSNNFTIEFWTKPTAEDVIAYEGVPNSIGTRIVLHPTHGTSNWGSGHAGVGVSVGTNTITVIEHANQYLQSQLVWVGNIEGWTHVAVVYVNKTPKLYVNGTLVRTGLTSGYNNIHPSLGYDNYPSYTNTNGIGTGMNGGHYEGFVDELKISDIIRYTSNFTPPYQLTNDANTIGLYHFNEGSGNIIADESSNTNNGILNGPTWSTDVPGQTFSLQFDGDLDYVEIADNDILSPTDITIEFWAKQSGVGGGRDQYIFKNVDGSNIEYGVGVNSNGTDQGLYCYIGSAFIQSNIFPIFNQWNHIAATFNSSTGVISLFLNGQLVASDVRTTSITNTSGLLRIGWAQGPSYNSFQGLLDEVRISNVVRYSSNFTPIIHFDNDPNTIALYHIDEGTGSVTNDSSNYSNNGIIYGAIWSNDVPTKSVALQSPDGGENWTVGEQQNIVWTSNLVDNIKIEYSTNDGNTWLEVINSTPASNGSYLWTIPNTPSQHCKVKISDVLDSTVYDISNSSFHIDSYNPIAYYPFNGNTNDATGNGYNGINYGATLATDRFGQSGKAYSFDGINDYIDLSNTEGLNFTTGGFTLAFWLNYTELKEMVPIVKSTYQILGGYGFAIYPAPRIGFFIHMGELEGVITPGPYNDGNWHFVVGIYTGSSVKLYVDNELTGTLTTPYTIFNDVKIRIGKFSSNNPDPTFCFKGKIDDIRIFSRPISEAEITTFYHEGGWPISNVTVQAPNGGESWIVGTQQNITWTSNNVNNVKIEYSTNSGVSWVTIINSTPSSGIYSWTVPNSPSSNCKVKITNVTNPSTYDESDNLFSIIQPSISVSSPNGGEGWQIGTVQNISWSSNNVNNVKIEYTTNNGSNWNTIIGSTPSDGTYEWTIPNTPSTQCKVRISDASNSSIFDESNNTFSIVEFVFYALIQADSIWNDDDYDGLELGLVDGSGSYISQGTITNYEWYVNNEFVTNGVAPTIELTTGTNVVKLIVYNNTSLSTSDSMNISIYSSKLSTGGAILSGVSQSENSFYVTSMNNGVYRIDSTGTILQSYLTGGSIRSSLCISNVTGLMYVGSTDTRLYCFDTNLNSLWDRGLGGVVNNSATVNYNGETVYAGANDNNTNLGFLKSLVASTGSPKWTFQTDGTILSSPIVLELVDSNYVVVRTIIYFGTSKGTLYAVEDLGSSQSLFWSATVNPDSAFVSSPAFSEDGMLYIGSKNGYLYRFSWDGSYQSGWKKYTGGPIISSPVIDENGIVYIASGSGYVYGFDKEFTFNSDPVKTFYQNVGINGTPGLGPDGSLLVGGDNGKFFSLNKNAATNEMPIKWYFQSSGPVYAPTLVTGNGIVYIGSTNGDLFIMRDPSIGESVSLTNYEWPTFKGNNQRSKVLRLVTQVTSMDDEKDIISSYDLSQNFPNPFNPSTRIRYQIPKSGFVILKIYDILGNEVEVLVNREMNTGSYEVTFDASSLPSGIYFYQLRAGDFVQTKKMILMK